MSVIAVEWVSWRQVAKLEVDVPDAGAGWIQTKLASHGFLLYVPAGLDPAVLTNEPQLRARGHVDGYPTTFVCSPGVKTRQTK